MTFWKTLGHMAEAAAKAGNPLLGVFDAARVAAQTENPEDGPDSFKQNATQLGAAFFKSSAPHLAAQGGLGVVNSDPAQKLLAPVVWTGNQASHGLSTVAAVGGALSDAGETGVDALWSNELWSKDTWEQAWDASEGVSGGEAIVNDMLGNRTDPGRRWWAGDDADLQAERQKTAFKVSAGAMDIISTWYADPTIVGGKVAKAARLGSRIVDGADAEKVFDALPTAERGLAERAGGALSSAPEETASRLYHHVAKTDGMGIDETAAYFKQNLERSGDAGPIVGILGHAGRIADVAVQRQVKADALLAAAGSTQARDRLMQAAPQIARAVQRVSLPPESFQIVDDMVAEGVTGDALIKAAGRWASKGNQKELEAYAKELDDIHTRIAATAKVGEVGGVENVAGSVLGTVKSKYRAGMAREFYFQPGPASRTVRVVHWATGQRMKGVIATDDAVRGHDELMDTMMRSRLFPAEQRKAVSEQWWLAPDQAARSNMAQALPEIMLNKLAAKHFAGDRKLLDHTIKSYRGWSSAARTYTTKQMEAARAANGTRVVLEDPLTGTPTSIDRALFETHIANNVAIPDVQVLERLVRHAKGAGTATDRALKSGEWALNTAESANDLWRTLTLMRPGFVVRTQLDTQARSAMTIGATTVVRDAMKGLGHKVTDRLKGAEVVKVEALASDLLRQQHLAADAADLRAKASVVGGDAGRKMLARADALEEEAAKTVQYDAPARRLVTEDRTLKLKGGEVTTRAAASEVEARNLVAALHTGDVSIGDAITQIQGKIQMRMTQNSGSWVTTLPDEPTWAAAWLRSKDAMMQSKAGRKIVDALDEPTVDMVRHLRADADVKAAWKAVRDRNPEFESWLDRAISQVEWTAPTREVRDALRSGKILEQSDAEALFKKVGDEGSMLPDRPPVHAPEMDMLDPSKNGIESAMDLAKKVVRILSDQPDTVLGRVPMYTEKYFTHYRELAQRELDRTGELGVEARAKIEGISRHRAIQDVRQTMYDTARFTGAHDRVARMGFAFLGAWEDSMRAWGRMFYDDPSRVGKLAKIWYAPERGGLIVDENGNRVRPGDKAREKWIVLPVQWLPGVDYDEFKIRKDSFNSMFQGEVPWAPGFGPGVQVLTTQIAARTFPEIADPNFEVKGVNVGSNPVLRQMFGFGLPKTGATTGEQIGSVVEDVKPGWYRRLENIFDGNSDQFNDAYAMALNSEILKAREAGKDPNEKRVLETADAKARKTARSMMFLEFVSNWGLGMSGEGATKADFYRQRYREISKNADALYARGSSPTEEMLRQHPEAAGLEWSFSENKTGINASLKVEDRVRKFGKDIQKNPDFGWFYIGSDNVGGEFSAASYSAQFGREATPGSGDTWRSKLSNSEIREKTAASLGWDEYYKVKDAIDAKLAERGLHSTQQKGAEDLAAVMKDFRNSLSAENPSWAKDYNSFDSTKMQTFLTQVAEPALKDGRLKNRSDIKAMRDYLEVRTAAMAQANANGYSLGSQKAANLRAILNELGAALAQENIGFSQMWQRVLQREVDTGEKDALVDSSSTSSSPTFRF
ncbi:hypothetical protein [Phycicoccus sp. Soil802]|uniref:hypothetical protein n=1 Tax=Phycicoccus sp. Soil802 TaxID=1736414 RepID=UPI0007038FC3|nr:hypothetical protein [Phycicoccus sp. Soil802]KRF22917.1 hypothetical protein ASG91_16215 [Phycicoccus sp. Soil802]